MNAPPDKKHRHYTQKNMNDPLARRRRPTQIEHSSMLASPVFPSLKRAGLGVNYDLDFRPRFTQVIEIAFRAILSACLP
jgi:hypothetical protein